MGRRTRGAPPYGIHTSLFAGGAHFISPQQLHALTAAGDGQAGIKLVMVNCCYSAACAEYFVAAGIPHVIASRLELADAAVRVGRCG